MLLLLTMVLETTTTTSNGSRLWLIVQRIRLTYGRGLGSFDYLIRGGSLSTDFLSLLGGKFPPPWPMLLHQARMTSHLAVTKGSVVCRVQPAAYSHDRRRYNPFSLFPPSRISIFVKLGDESSQSFCSAERREASHDGSIRDRSTGHRHWRKLAELLA